MRKALKIVLLLGVLTAGLLLYFDQSRSFYCVGKNRCITVWKRIGGNCYIIPGKYYGLIKPSDNYIKTTNTQYLAIYFSDRIPNTLVIKNEGTSQGFVGGYTIYNKSNKKVSIINYTQNCKRFFYKLNAKYHNDLNADAYLLNIDIKENYATDKNGRKL